MLTLRGPDHHCHYGVAADAAPHWKTHLTENCWLTTLCADSWMCALRASPCSSSAVGHFLQAGVTQAGRAKRVAFYLNVSEPGVESSRHSANAQKRARALRRNHETVPDVDGDTLPTSITLECPFPRAVSLPRWPSVLPRPFPSRAPSRTL